MAGHRAHRFGASSETAEQLQLALETSEIAAAAMTARMKLPDIEERGKPKRRPIPDHIRRMCRAYQGGNLARATAPPPRIGAPSSCMAGTTQPRNRPAMAVRHSHDGQN
ncbi:hypothetical protein EB844_16715 [Paracoccus pantotrophus]|nr:hypothetical protein EB844_16715 [Paracoccus pantotrophus]